jgi:hypothetical protein
MKKLKFLLEYNGIETRSIVGGNLLIQPFLKKYSKFPVPNATILNNNGVYIGNNQYVTNKMIDKLFEIIKTCVHDSSLQI